VEVARVLEAPLDVLVVRKLGVPFQPELGFGAIGEGGTRVLDRALVRRAHLSAVQVAAIEDHERAELDRRARLYRDGLPPMTLSGRAVVIVDDGLATGVTAGAAASIARQRGARRIVIAVPVASAQAMEALAGLADEVVALHVPEYFGAVGEWYQDFRQTSDEEVTSLLAGSRRAVGGPADPEAHDPALTHDPAPSDRSAPTDLPASSDRQLTERSLLIPSDGVELAGDLRLPSPMTGVVLFAHGSGSSRSSPRNQALARSLNAVSLGTLLFDLLTPTEAEDRRHVFDVAPLGTRLVAATAWIRAADGIGHLPIGYFGASTGAAAALWAAADPGSVVGAVVCRGGRPDLTGPRLEAVRSPVLFVVGGADETVLALNQQAAAALECEHRIVVVPGATHLFEEPGALEAVARLAVDWFTGHLVHEHDDPRV